MYIITVQVEGSNRFSFRKLQGINKDTGHATCLYMAEHQLEVQYGAVYIRKLGLRAEGVERLHYRKTPSKFNLWLYDEYPACANRVARHAFATEYATGKLPSSSLAGRRQIFDLMDYQSKETADVHA